MSNKSVPHGVIFLLFSFLFILFFFKIPNLVYADTLDLIFNYAGGEAPGYPGEVSCSTPIWKPNCDRWGTTTGGKVGSVNGCCENRLSDYCSSSYSAVSNFTTLSCWSYPPPTPTPTPTPPPPCTLADSDGLGYKETCTGLGGLIKDRCNPSNTRQYALCNATTGCYYNTGAACSTGESCRINPAGEPECYALAIPTPTPAAAWCNASGGVFCTDSTPYINYSWCASSTTYYKVACNAIPACTYGTLQNCPLGYTCQTDEKGKNPQCIAPTATPTPTPTPTPLPPPTP